ncbi:hypothetical protein ACSDR0_30495 [Streptosporangium sp. G11]|uniref:hypothetical protein n=1 Tax=Streptosporangium sp. G11 TaxID=3436926 RepID=UPI003EC1560D
MDPIVMAAGTALVTAMATDAWQQARAGAVALWRRFAPEQVKTVEAELDEVRDQILAARREEDVETEQALAGEWRVRLARLLRQDPQAAAELRRVLDEVLAPALPAADRTRIKSIVMNATAHDDSRVYQAGGDMHITEP